ncbi:MAG: DUF3822 family protein [Winogradskyella sp.]
MKNINIKELSIQISLNGLSFCILNRTTSTIEVLKSVAFEEKLTPFTVLNRLKTELDDSVYNQNFHSVNIIHQNDLVALVPAEMYDENYKADYLKFNNKILKTDFITTDEIAVNNGINVYIPYVNINNYIFERFGEFSYKHASSILIDNVLQETKPKTTPQVFINVNYSNIEVMVIGNNSDLMLFNIFESTCKEDFIYYVLFVFEQLGLDTELSVIKLSGLISEGDEYYNLLYTYVRYIEIIEPKLSFNFSNITSSNLHNHYLILNSF